MADKNEQNESATGEAQEHQAFDDLTVLSNVQEQSLGAAQLNVVRPVEGGASGLGNMALVNEGGTFTPETAQRAQVNVGQDVGTEATSTADARSGGASDNGGTDGALTGNVSGPAQAQAAVAAQQASGGGLVAQAFRGAGTGTAVPGPRTGAAATALNAHTAGADTHGALIGDVAATSVGATGAEFVAPTATTQFLTQTSTTTESVTDTATSSSGTAQQGITGSISLSDSIGDSKAYLVDHTTATAANGTVKVNTDGTYTYVSNKGFVGTDTVHFATTDSHGVIGSATADVTVSDSITDRASSGLGTAQHAITGTFSSSDAAGRDSSTSLAAATTGTASHGSVTVNSDGTYTYVSNSGFVGTDTIHFSTTDTHGVVGTVTTTVVVTDTLTQTESSGTATARTGITGSWSVSDAAGLTETPVAAAGHGTVHVGNDGHYTYTSSAGFIGTDTITFTTTDGSGVAHTSTASVVVTDSVTASAGDATGDLRTGFTGTFSASDAALLTDTTSASSTHGGTVHVGADGHYTYTAAQGFVGTDTITFTTQNTHGDTVTSTATVTVSDTLTDTATGGVGTTQDVITGSFVVSDSAGLSSTSSATSANGGTVSIRADGTYTYVAAGGFTGTDTITFTTTDSHGVTSTATADVVVDAVQVQTNGATIAVPHTVSDTENHAASFALHVSDANAGESVTAVTITGAPAGSVLTVGGVNLTADSQGNFSLTPAQAADASLTITPPTDYSGTMTLQVNATADVSGSPSVTTSQAITVNVTPVTQGATITSPTTVADSENHTASFSLNVADAHANESVTGVTITGAPAGAVLVVDGVTIAQNADHSFTLTPNQAASASLAITPPTDYSGTMTLTVNATASELGAASVVHSQTIAVNVAAVTQGATITAPTAVSDIQGHAASFTLDVADSHLNENVTGVSITGAPAGTTLTVDGVTIAQNSDHSFTLTPAQASSGSLAVTPPSSYSGSLTLTVNATAAEAGATAVTTHQTITLDVTAVSSTGATIAGPTAVTDVENHAASFTLTVGDYSSNAANESITNVSVSGAPSGSTLTVGGVAVTQNADGSFDLSPDQASDASLAITPPADYTGTMTLTVSATTMDATTEALTTNTHVTTITVTPETQGAAIAAATSLTGTENSSSNFTLNVSDTHLNESVTGVSITGAPSGSTLTVGGTTIAANADGSFTLTPAQAADASLSITPPTDYSGTMHLVVNATAQEIGAAATTTSQTITLTVTPETQGATVTAPSSAMGSENSATAISINVSDTHLGESVTSVQITGAPTGTVLHVDGVAISANADGSFTLTAAQAHSASLEVTPPTDYSGHMSLQVEATAQNGTATSVTSVQTIDLNVAPVTQGATITAPTTVAGTENSATSISLNVTDTHLHESVTGVTITGAPAGSTLTVGSDVITANADGSFTLTAAQASNSSLQLTPPTDYTGTVTLTVNATADETGAASVTHSQTITVDVHGITQGASIDAPQSVGGLANTATPFMLNVSDGHLGEAVTTVTITGAPVGSTLTVDGQVIAANADGSFTLTPIQASSAGLAVTPPTDYVGTINLTVSATADLTGAAPVTTTQNVSLNIVAGAETGATIAGPIEVATTENHSASFSLNVADTHASEHVSSVTITGAPSGTTLSVGGVTITADASGTFTLTPAQASNASLAITPPTDFSGSLNLQVHANSVDGSGTVVTNTQSLTVDVTAVTQGATVTAPNTLVGSENSHTSIALGITDTHTGESVVGVTITGAPSGSTLTVGGVTVTADGSGTFHLTSAQANDSTLAITPPTDYSGTMTLHVNATAENGSAATVTTSQAITVEVGAVTQGATITAPTAVTTTENHSASIPITVADSHTGENITGVVISGAPPGSTLTVGTHTYLPDSTGAFNLTPSQAASGTLSLNPPKDFSGSIVLEIDATAQNGTAAPATISHEVDVTVTGVTQGATIIAPSNVADTENHSASISLNVSDAHTGESVSAVSITGAPAGSSLTIGGVTIAQNADHSFTLTPTQAASASLSLTPPTDYSGSMTLHVNATASSANAADAIATQTINVTVAPITQGATISAPQAVGMFKGSTSSFSLNVTDTHSGEALTAVTITGAPTGSTLTLAGHTLTSTSGTFTLTSSQVAALASGAETLQVKPPSTYSGLFTLHVNATADNGTAAAVTTTQNISVDVSSTTSGRHSTSGPQIASLGGTLSDTENHSTSFVLNTTDTRSGSSVNAVTITGAPAGSTMVVDGITLTANSSGTFTVPSGHYVNGTIQVTPPTDYYGTMTLTVHATDTSSRTSTQTVTINVAEVSQGATITTTPNSVNDTPNSPATISLHVTDHHAGETVNAITISGAPSGSTMTVGGQTVTANSAGVFTLTAAQVTAAQTAGGDSLQVTPPHNYTGVMYLQVNATVLTSTGSTETNTQVVPINVAQPTIGATITAPTTLTDAENHSASFSLGVTDTHLGESVTTVTITGAPSGTVLTVDGHTIHAHNGTFTLTPAQAASASLVVTPPHDYIGTMNLQVNATAVNSQGLTETNTHALQVTVSGVTQGATIQLPSHITGKEDSSISVNANIQDFHSGESITAASVSGAPAGSTLTIDGTVIHQNADHSFTLTPAQAESGNFKLTPPIGYVGDVTLTFSATAQNGTAAPVTTTQSVTLTVQDVGPTVDRSQHFSVTINGTVVENIGAQGAEGNTLTYSVYGDGPHHGTVTFDQTGKMTYVADSGYSGSDQYQVMISDGHGGTVIQTESVTVINPFIDNRHDDFHGHNSDHGDGRDDHFRDSSDHHFSFHDSDGADKTVYGNDGSNSHDSSRNYTTQLHITAADAHEAFGATMSYCLNNVPEHATVVDASGTVLDAAHLTDAQINSGVYLSFSGDHVHASFDLSVTANLTDTDGSVYASHSTVAVDTSFMGADSTIIVGDGNDVIYGGAGNNTIQAGDGNDHIYTYDGNNTITVGAGNDTIQAGDGDNTISLTGTTGTDDISLGHGLNNLDLGTGHDTTLTLSGSDAVDHITMGAGSLYIDLSHTTGDANVVIHNQANAMGGETFFMDFAGHDHVTGGSGSNWTDTIDLSNHTQNGVGLTVVDSEGNTHSIAAGDHGTLDLKGTLGHSDVSGHVYSDAAQQHEVVQFTNVEKLIY